MSRWVRRAAERRVRIASRRRARRSPRAAGGLGTCSFRRSGRLRGCSAFRHPHQGTSVALLPGTRLAHSSDPSGLSSYGLTKSLGEGDILVASEVVTFCFFLDSTVILICTFLFGQGYGLLYEILTRLRRRLAMDSPSRPVFSLVHPLVRPIGSLCLRQHLQLGCCGGCFTF